MKIMCDVCEKNEASFFCVADEAALCAACDHRVHHANKLAGKHHRFSLLPPSAPLCDICQEKRAFLFCQQDRALLCKDCDLPIHKANEHTKKHTRFLLTGVKLSPNSSLYSASQQSPSSTDDVVSQKQGTPSPAKSTTSQSTTSSISEYLMETLPGWHVEDLLDSSSPSPYQSGENGVMPIWDGDFQKSMSVFPAENMGFWVPQTQNQSFQSADLAFGLTNGFQSKEFMGNNNIKSSRKRSEDNSFAVPQITPSSTTIKKSRNFW